ncbi:uncharacterized protein LOC126568514 [Anopheles maculipalpis]|uniref:uncharacterized protein LOC126568514 n=1 Tax=Anopheles maculipalpis TaxID=1496333 RepID=UPI002159AB6F|nr:uncharacterized protein LOC126568514 [Anopheles maculipalpis]
MIQGMQSERRRAYFFCAFLCLASLTTRGMLLKVDRKSLAMVLVLVATGASLPSVPRPKQELDVEHGLSAERAAVTTVGKCLETSALIYVETVIVMKDDSSRVRGTIEISIGKPIIIDCVRIVAKAEHERMALKGHKLLGPNTIELSIAEEQPAQSNALEYSVYVYATIASKGQS